MRNNKIHIFEKSIKTKKQQSKGCINHCSNFFTNCLKKRNFSKSNIQFKNKLNYINYILLPDNKSYIEQLHTKKISLSQTRLNILNYYLIIIITNYNNNNLTFFYSLK